ncbi:PLDc N-terminal domain-containing protein [Frondihabitans peucedani]|jgi:uncharacterized membrane protein|uniref:Cardiolipin synthase N-terminal domain-containing protein n=1 Tax=Frondihabitans peucedani TaxID=598626 RepID=A0ABP8E5X8_9MICO
MENLPHLVPSIALLVVLVGLAALWVAAVVSILRSALLTPVVKALWILAVIAFSFVGPLVWLAVSAYQRRRDTPALTPSAS